MKILQLTKNYPPQFGGIESVTYDVTEGLNDAGLVCDVMCSSLDNSTKVEGNKYKIFRIGTLRNIAATSISPRIVSWLRKIKSNYDILQLHFPNPMVALAVFIVRPKNKIIVHWHSDIIRQRFIYPFFRPLEKWVLNRADVIIGTSENYIAYSKPLKEYQEKIKVIPLGISVDRFVCKEEQIEGIKNRFKNKKIIFSLGRLVYYKGFEDLIEAGKYIDDDTVVLIGGAGELKEKLEEQIKENNLEKKVFLLGRIPDEELACYYKSCDIFCLASNKRSEAFGVVQLEAMYFGKPIVATQIAGSGVSWVNQENVTGFNVPVNDGKKLAEAIMRILNNEDLKRKFSANALKRFEELFTRKHMVDEFVSLYNDLMKVK